MTERSMLENLVIIFKYSRYRRDLNSNKGISLQPLSSYWKDQFNKMFNNW